MVILIGNPAKYTVSRILFSERNLGVNIIIAQENKSTKIDAMLRKIITKVSFCQFCQASLW